MLQVGLSLHTAAHRGPRHPFDCIRIVLHTLIVAFKSSCSQLRVGLLFTTTAAAAADDDDDDAMSVTADHVHGSTACFVAQM
jgi:hypothetical protein